MTTTDDRCFLCTKPLASPRFRRDLFIPDGITMLFLGTVHPSCEKVYLRLVSRFRDRGVKLVSVVKVEEATGPQLERWERG